MSDAAVELEWQDYITFHSSSNEAREFPPSIVRMMAEIGSALESVHGEGSAVVVFESYRGMVLKIRETEEHAAKRVEKALKDAQNIVRYNEEQRIKKEEKAREAAEALGVDVELYKEVVNA